MSALKHPGSEQGLNWPIINRGDVSEGRLSDGGGEKAACQSVTEG